MTATTLPARFMANNFLGDDIVISATSEATGYPVENIYDQLRSRPWVSAGFFAITSENCKLYFNDGSARTATLYTGNYTAATLATEIAAAVVRSGASATVVASAYSTAPYVWQLTFSTSVTLSLSSGSDDIWDTLGFVGSTDRVSTVFVADAARAHTYEQLTFNLGVARTPTFLGLIGAIDEILSISSSAVVTLMASNLDSWSSPAVTVTMTRTDYGVKEWLDSQTSLNYEYFALRIVDRENALGTAGISIGYLYLGDHETLTTSNIGIGWSKEYVDNSVVMTSRDGTRFANTQPKFRSFRGVAAGNMLAAERRELEQFFYDLGISQSFFVSFDPALEVSADVDELTLFAHLPTEVIFTHVIRDYMSMRVEIEESV